jgi:hypothetical protein
MGHPDYAPEFIFGCPASRFFCEKWDPPPMTLSSQQTQDDVEVTRTLLRTCPRFVRFSSNFI